MNFQYFGVVIAVFNLVGAFFVAKLLLVQVSEWCKRKKTKKVENSSSIRRNLKTTEYSDTESMLMRSSEDWGIRSYYIN